jgi:hypothetical protein
MLKDRTEKPLMYKVYEPAWKNELDATLDKSNLITLITLLTSLLRCEPWPGARWLLVTT